MNLLKSSAVVGGLTIVSRVLGFVRDVLLARVLGAGPVSDAFFVAFRLPNLFRRQLAEGAFNAAFVPLYSRRLEGGDEDGPPGETNEQAADRFASETFSALFAILLVLVIAAQLAMPVLIMALAPGYIDEPDWVARATVLGVLTMPYILFMSLTAMFGGVLNARGRFAAFAFAPVLLNIVLIALLAGPIGTDWSAARWLAGGVAVAGVLQCLVVYWGVRRQGVRLRLLRPRLTPGVKRVAALGAPGAFAAGVVQFNIVVTQQIASGTPGAVSWLSWADRLYQLPLGVIGIAMGVALLPALSRRLRAGAIDDARDSLNRAVEIAAFFTLPATAALVAASSFWIQAIFEHGRFLADDTAATAPLLFAFALGLPSFIAVKVFAPAFFAREDTKTPMRYAIVSVVTNIALGLFLYFTIDATVQTCQVQRGCAERIIGLAAATSVAGWINALLLMRTLLRDGLFRPDARLLSRLPRSAAAAALMGVVVWWLVRWAQPQLGQGWPMDYVLGGAVAAAGLAVYMVAAVVLGAARRSDIRLALGRGDVQRSKDDPGSGPPPSVADLS